MGETILLMLLITLKWLLGKFGRFFFLQKYSPVGKKINICIKQDAYQGLKIQSRMNINKKQLVACKIPGISQ